MATDDAPPTNTVRVCNCPSWTDFTREVREVRGWPSGDGGMKYADRVIYRGHSDPGWKLISRLQRKFLHYTRSADGTIAEHNALAERGLERYDRLCSRLLEEFKRYAAGRPGFAKSATNDEIWALGRHHGLVTPLLDWTASPYVAAFFAFEECHQRLEVASSTTLAAAHDQVHVWGLRFWEPLEVPGEFEIVSVSPESAVRQRAQSGLFTRLRFPETLDLRSYLESRGLARCLELYVIDGNAAIHALQDLVLMNIHAATLFPDLDGAALQANFDAEGTAIYSSMLKSSWPEHF